MIQAAKIIGTGLGLKFSSFFANKIYLKQWNKFSTSINKYHPSIKLEEKSKFSVSTPSDPDIDPAILKSPKFENDKLNVNENIQRELQQYAESSAREQSPLDFVLEKQQTEMPDIADSDGGGD
jgi:hypothetical protein